MGYTLNLTARLRPTVLAGGAALVAAGVMVLAATWAAAAIEARTARAITSRLLADGITWASVTTDGLRVNLSGLAPNEAARFRAVNIAGGLVDAGRIRDGFEVTAVGAIAPPRFSVEVLRNADEISLIGGIISSC